MPCSKKEKGHIYLSPHYQTSLSPTVESFSKDGYFLNEALKKRSLVQSDATKNFFEEKKQKEKQEKRIKDKCLVILGDYDDDQNQKLVKKEIEKTKEFDECSFDNFSYGFSSKTTQNPSFSVASQYLKMRLKTQK